MSDKDLLPERQTKPTDWYEKFSSQLGVNVIVGIPQREGYVRKGVITNYPASSGPLLVRNFNRHVDAGYTIVFESGDSIKDDRAFSPNTNARPNTFPAPLTGKTSDGYDYVVMEISKAKEKENMEGMQKENHQRHMNSIKGKVTQRGNNIYVKEQDEMISPTHPSNLK